jgi:8-oxo-dGTP diphosphatase
MRPTTHLAVYGLVEHGQQIAFIKKSRGPYTGSWDLPGGKIEFGETPRQALEREIQEELGLTITAARLLDADAIRFSFTDLAGTEIDLHHVAIFYTCEVATGKLRSGGDGHDVRETCWFMREKARGLALSPFAKTLLSL